jgi:hypothetical protein
MKAKYKQLINAGKVALTAAMRKLILLANTLLKANWKWAQNSLDQYGYSSHQNANLCATSGGPSSYCFSEFPRCSQSAGNVCSVENCPFRSCRKSDSSPTQITRVCDLVWKIRRRLTPLSTRALSKITLSIVELFHGSALVVESYLCRLSRRSPRREVITPSAQFQLICCIRAAL